MSYEGDIKKIVKKAREQNFRVTGDEPADGGHWILFFGPDDLPGAKPCQIGRTGHSKGNAFGNLLSCLKRKGYKR